MKPHAIQITLKNGKYIFIGVNNYEEYDVLKNKITKSNFEYVDLVRECTIKRDEVTAIEFVTAKKGEER